MAIPKSKYSSPKHTPGKEYTLNGSEYRGWYVETYQKRFYTGKTILQDSQEIFPIIEKSSSENIFTEQEITPSDSNRTDGVMNRYIIQRVSNRKIIEVTKEKFDLFKNKPGYRRIIIFWIIRGPSQNKFFNGYIYYGAEYKNKETVSKLKSTIPGISNFFKNYSEFVE
jgi:hypothetical protein